MILNLKINNQTTSLTIAGPEQYAGVKTILKCHIMNSRHSATPGLTLGQPAVLQATRIGLGDSIAR